MKDLLFIRADATAEIGIGHVMRCMALAQAWQERGGEVIFIGCWPNQSIQKRITGQGFAVFPLANVHPDPVDLDHTRRIIDTHKPGNASGTSRSWFVLDGYHFDPDYQSAIRNAGPQVMVIDDYNHLPVYHADIVLNQNIDAGAYRYRTDPNSRILPGTSYALLRREFLDYPVKQKHIPEKARHLLVTLGGADPLNVTATIIKAIIVLNDPALHVKIVAGQANPHIKKLRSMISSAPCKLDLLNDPDMPRLMDWADLVVSAAGSTVWELCYFGIPMVLVSFAENQQGIAEGLSQKRAAESAGWHTGLEQFDLADRLARLIESQKQRRMLSIEARHLIDGKGVNRVLRQILAGNTRLRQADKGDCKLLYRWANDQAVRQNSFSPGKIGWTKHVNWFQEKLNNPDCCLYILTNSLNMPIGQIRFDISKKFAEIDYSIDAQFRNLGMGKHLLLEGLYKFKSELNRDITIQGNVRPQNIASLKAFKAMGFTEKPQETAAGKSGPYITYHLKSWGRRL